jgi:hypothetical protein
MWLDLSSTSRRLSRPFLPPSLPPPLPCSCKVEAGKPGKDAVDHVNVARFFKHKQKAV